MRFAKMFMTPLAMLLEHGLRKPALFKGNGQTKRWLTSSMNTPMTQRTPIIIYTHLNLISIHSRGRGLAFPLHNPINYEKT